MQMPKPGLELIKDWPTGSLHVHVFMEKHAASASAFQPPARETLYFYVTGPLSANGGYVREITPTLSTPSHGVLACVVVARMEDKGVSRSEESHADSFWMQEIADQALTIARRSQDKWGSVIQVPQDHIQLLARAALKAHKESMSQCADEMMRVNYSNAPVPVRPTIAHNAYRALEAFYMLNAMGLKSNPRALIAEWLQLSDNQVKHLLAMLQKSGVLSQRPALEERNRRGRN